MWRPADIPAYAYLLGWYLGDGYASTVGRTYQLVITADLAYPRIIAACRAAVPAGASCTPTAAAP